ncbi:MAG TPA: hypothetical protein VKQ28_05195 [Candidatus Acidoferrum sp.]|nr:hypothetical protein [Candidatus Acidoferrum sp.]
MRNPLTADERDRRVVQYLLTLNKGQIAEFRLTRLNRVANFRKALIQLMEEFVTARAEELAAGMIEAHAPERPQLREAARAVAVAAKRRRMPVWVKRLAEAEKSRTLLRKSL